MPWTMRHLWRRRLYLALLLELLLVLAYVVTLRAGQGQDVVNTQLQMVTKDFERRIGRLEESDPLGRLKVLESDMTEVKWLARGAAIAIIGQLVAGLVGRPRRKADEELT